jgi:hypothetical protein
MKKLNVFRMGLSAALALMFALSAVPALANSSGTASITVVAPAAALGQRVEVQWGDPLGGWHTVDGWTGTLDHLTPQGEPFTSRGVFSANFGQRPFRWVIYNLDGQTLWALGPGFILPDVDGTNYTQRLDHTEGVTASTPPAPPTVTAPSGGTSVVPATGVTMLAGHTFIYGLGGRGDSKITILAGGFPKFTWIAVQWRDVDGTWRLVNGWQGMASSIDHNGVLLQQWDVPPSLFGAGPFRWALYNFQGGSLYGVSPEFNMPLAGRLNEYMALSPYVAP